ncbi:hypothetical protein EWH99_12205 [Sporolactobacillus sp. THM7-7]|nr:hypothetical protein EWH99_12205 [Sporolactobacillus sp. THM7-7]
MDKLLHKDWLVKIISFVTALMLYAIVSAGENPSPSPTGTLVGNNDQAATITEKLDIRYDTDSEVVSGAPKTVKIRLEGSSDNVLKARLLASRRAYIDLTDMKPGTYDVKVQTSGFPAGLRVTPSPKNVRVTLQKKTSKEFPVGVDILNKNDVSDEFSIGDPVIDPESVTVTGGADTIDSIAFIKGVIDVKGADSTVDRMIALHAYDNNGSQLNVSVVPSSVHVRVPMEKTSKILPVRVSQNGRPAEGYVVGSIDISPKDVSVFTEDPDMLDNITNIPPLPVSVDGLNQDQTFSMKVPVPDGATKVSPSEVSVTVHIESDDGTGQQESSSGGSGDSLASGENRSSAAQDSSGSNDTSSSEDSSSSAGTSSSDGSSESSNTKVFNNIPITMTGVGSDYDASFDSVRHVKVSVTGSSSAIEQLTAQDIQAKVDLADLDAGKHRVAVRVTVPGGLSARPSPQNISVTVSSKSRQNNSSA